MELTKIQKHLLEGLRINQVHVDQAVGIMISLKDNEDGMMELMEYMATDHPTAHEIIKKSIDILIKYK